MYENYRDSFNRRAQDDDQREEATRRWRRSEERYRREAHGEPLDDDRSDSDFGRGRSAFDEGQSGRSGGFRSAERGYGQRSYYASRNHGGADDDRQVHWHERDRELRAGHPYQGTYGGTGDSSYFTGQQGSWAVGAPQVPSAYYGSNRHFGVDYRPHGYDGDRDDRRGFWDRASDEVASWFGDDEAARRREEDHRGRGPKDYTRSDERIRDDANDKLTDDWRVDASNVTVTVKDGEITLDGTVASREAKRRAEDVVDGISGVKHVQNNLRVQAAAASGTAYAGNWATNTNSTAEGGTISQTRSDPAKQTDKI